MTPIMVLAIFQKQGPLIIQGESIQKHLKIPINETFYFFQHQNNLVVWNMGQYCEQIEWRSRSNVWLKPKIQWCILRKLKKENWDNLVHENYKEIRVFSWTRVVLQTQIREFLPQY